VRRGDCEAGLAEVGARLPALTRVFLVGETSQLWEGWIDEAPVVQLAADPPARSALARALSQCSAGTQRRVILESPGDVIPLPAGHESRARAMGDGVRAPVSHPLDLVHFDPYSVSFRALARGDEADYHLVLRYLRHGWMTLDAMDALLVDVLPRFSNETIQQDPAEFRRKYKGLKQMWAAEGALAGQR
jgi:hypothetical protein